MSSESFVAEICLFPFTFAPVGWALCDGQLLPISQYTALFSLLGTYYGGDGMSNFALPDLQGRVPIHVGQGPGLQNVYFLGQSGGEETVALSQAQVPSHTHAIQADGNHFHDTQTSPSGALLVNGAPNLTFSTGTQLQIAIQAMSPLMVGVAGGNAAHNNLMPYLAVNYCIALQGAYPPRS